MPCYSLQQVEWYLLLVWSSSTLALLGCTCSSASAMSFLGLCSSIAHWPKALALLGCTCSSASAMSFLGLGSSIAHWPKVRPMAVVFCSSGTSAP
jgi:hypothetical protein